MTPQELRASILNLAIQGKLVEHFASELPVAVDTSFCGDTSDFFEISENWKWLSIKDVVSVNTGLSFKKQDQRDSSNGSLRVLRGGNIGDDYKYHLYEDDVYVELDQFQTKYIQLIEGDVITPSVTSIEKICKTGFIDQDLPAVTAGGFVYIIRCLDRSVIEPKYLLYFISSFFNKEQCKPNIHKSGQAFYNLKKSGFIEQPICVPPLAEQKRIVAKIEELLPYIDRYEQAWSKFEEFNKRFPVDMQKSILQMAIQGKLVPQLPEEGTGDELFQQIQAEKQALVKAGKIKKEKPLPEITEDDIPFDIPDSWKWAKIGDIFSVIRGSSPRPKGSPLYWSSTPTKHHWVTIKDITSFAENGFLFQTHEFLTDEGAKKSTFVPGGELIIAVSGSTTGKFCILGIDGYIYDGLAAIINPTNIIGCEYLKYFFMWIYERLNAQKIGSAFPNINTDMLKNTLIPLPPLAEQKRIVAKLEEILPLCERLK